MDSFDHQHYERLITKASMSLLFTIARKVKRVLDSQRVYVFPFLETVPGEDHTLDGTRFTVCDGRIVVYSATLQSVLKGDRNTFRQLSPESLDSDSFGFFV